ncbi:MAG: calcineurin-like phosphoesterase family protein [Pseudomonadota bacterium]
MRRAWTLAFLLAAIGCETTPIDGTAPLIEASSDTAPQTSHLFTDYRGAPEVVRGDGDGGEVVSGVVFEDRNANSQRDSGEPGIRGVKVSNGLDVVLTDSQGRYELPARDDMAVMVIQPSGYQVPHDSNWVPQFAYQHKPAGSPKALRYGGLAPTGMLPETINFPLIKTNAATDYTCAVLGDVQAYANQEVSYFRNSTIDDILDRSTDDQPECVLAVGDVMGDDLGLIPRMAELIGTLQAPQWWVHGNHDFDWDADFDEDSADSWRNLYGPNYYAFEIGEALFIVLDNVVYPCTRIDAQRPGREFCVEGDEKLYNARITDEQMAFVENLLARTDEDKLIVFAHHIPFVTFVDMTSPRHQTDNVTDLYALVGEREALSLSGHTHTIEVLEPGDRFDGWEQAVGVKVLPFRHIVAGAGSGAWYQGDFAYDGTPMALQRLGGPKGWLKLEITGATYRETYIGANVGRERRMWTSVNTPIFRSWFRQIMAWRDQSPDQRDPLPPLSINDLPDVQILTPRDLSRGSYVTANVWDGSSSTEVTMTIGDTTTPMQRTQSATGESANIGPDWADPFAAQRQLTVARYAIESRSGIARNQGNEVFRGTAIPPSVPQPQGVVADRNVHLWRGRLPESLGAGVHKVTVEATDRHGRVTQDTLIVEIRDRLPPARFRSRLWDQFENGPPIR